MSIHTVKPFDSVVVSVVTRLRETGVARPLLKVDAPKFVRFVRPCERFRANRRDAMAAVCEIFKTKVEQLVKLCRKSPSELL